MRTAANIVDRLLEADEIDPKGFVQARGNIEQYDPITIEGSYGTLFVDPYDGTVMRYTDYPEDDEEGPGNAYSDIVKFDLNELREWIRRNGSEEWAHRADEIVAPGGSFDIVDVAFWTDDGSLVPAEEDHRRMSWGNEVP